MSAFGKKRKEVTKRKEKVKKNKRAINVEKLARRRFYTIYHILSSFCF